MRFSLVTFMRVGLDRRRRYNPPMLIFLFALLGLVAGVVVNALADDLAPPPVASLDLAAPPPRRRLSRPHCPHCGHMHKPLRWLALARLAQGGRCPQCGERLRWRTLLVEVALVGLWLAALATTPAVDAALPFAGHAFIHALYVSVLVLIIVLDLEHRVVPHVITFPVTAATLLLSFGVPDNTWTFALLGAVTGYAIFLLFYWLGRLLYGPRALGFGDVTLSMMMGGMLGVHRIVLALVIGICLGGILGLLLLFSRRRGRFSVIAYGPYLAGGGIITLFWGMAMLNYLFPP